MATNNDDRKCSWCNGALAPNWFGANVVLDAGKGTSTEGKAYFCNDSHASFWKRSTGKRLLSFAPFVQRLSAEVRQWSNFSYSVIEVWPDGSRYFLKKRHVSPFNRQEITEELIKEGYGEITWLDR